MNQDLISEGQQDNPVAQCPYCNKQLPKFPSRKAACPFCKKIYYVRTDPLSGDKVVLTELQVDENKLAWAKKGYVDEAGDEDLKLIEYGPIDKMIVKAKRAFRDGQKDVAWGIYNKALITPDPTAGMLTGSNFLSSQWRILRPMVIQLMAEDKYSNALSNLIRLMGIEALEFGYNPKNPIQGIAPGTLEIARDAVGWGNITRDKCEQIFDDLKQTVLDNTEKMALNLDKQNGFGIASVQSIDWNILKQQLLSVLYTIN
jgi:hypothetical protein